MAKLKPKDNYIVILPFMVNELRLKGNELIIYAIIYGFSQTEGQTFSGGMQYLMDWTQSTRRGVEKSLQKLRERGLVGRIKRTAKYDYSVNIAECENANKVRIECKQSSYPPMRTKFVSECEQSSYRNKSHLINNNLATQDKYNINNPPLPPTGENDGKPTIKKQIENYTDLAELREALTEFVEVRKKLRKPFTDGAFKLMLSKLDKLATTDEDKAGIIQQSVINGWQGIFPLKTVEPPRAKSVGVLDEWSELYEEVKNADDKS